MNYIYRLSIAAFGILIFLSSCEVINPEEDVPSYLHVEKFKFNEVATSTTGKGGVQITDSWVYVNDQLLGVYEMPFTIPILAKGNTNIKIDPGIKLNGIAASRLAFPYYKRWETNATFIVDSVLTVLPETQYTTNAKFSFKENFEDTGFGFDTITSTTNVERVRLADTHPERERYVARAKMYSGKNTFKMITPQKFLIPHKSKSYLELDYRCNQEFGFTVIVKHKSRPSFESLFYRFNATSKDQKGDHQWNKIYIDLTQFVIANNQAESFGLGFLGQHNTAVDTGYFEIDNVKVVHL